ncbi:hypothetical protein ACIA5H_35215 [Nocardia sp. NPDC051900]|uniref:hypothetical protein n=1 Tax=Nocardia sp. NPDC051900 TaxID=3364326 RepID=UPI0037B0E80A
MLRTCAAHRDRIPEQFAAQAAARGEVISVPDEPVALRPAQVQDWYIEVERAAAEALASVGYPIDNTFIPVNAPDDLPSTCPHCGGELAWGIGPHVADAAARGNASAWECLGCRAAGPCNRPTGPHISREPQPREARGSSLPTFLLFSQLPVGSLEQRPDTGLGRGDLLGRGFGALTTAAAGRFVCLVANLGLGLGLQLPCRLLRPRGSGLGWVLTFPDDRGSHALT